MRSIIGIVALLLTVITSLATDEASTSAYVERVVVVPAKQIHEEGIAMKSGETVEFYLKSSRAMKFNIHYHEGENVTYERADKPLDRLNSTLTADAKRDYWLMWTNESTEPVALYYVIRRLPKRL